MISLHRNYHQLSTPWFARPNPTANTTTSKTNNHFVKEQQQQQHRSLSPDAPQDFFEDEMDVLVVDDEEPVECSMYVDDLSKDHQHVRSPAYGARGSGGGGGGAVVTFRDRYPPTHKRRPSSSSGSSDELDLPSDPRSWLREDVQTWIRHMSDLHGLPSVQSDRFLMNGKALCLMTMDMFCQRVPLGGKMLFKDFQLRLSMAMYQSTSKY